MISAFVDEEQLEWDKHLPLLTSAYRACVHEATGYSPNFLMFGREVYAPINMEFGNILDDPEETRYSNEHEYIALLRQKQELIFDLVRDNLAKAGQRQKRNHDVRLSVNNYKIGDLVYVMDSTKKKGKSPKLNPFKWLGPCVVTKKFNDLLFEIASKKTGKRRVLHHDRLKPFLSDTVPAWVSELQKKVSQVASPRRSTRKSKPPEKWGY